MPRATAVILLGILVSLLAIGCKGEPSIEDKSITEWINLLRHDDWAVQEGAVENISHLGASAVPYLLNALQAKDPTLRRGAVLTLGRIGKAAKEAVGPMLHRMAREEVAVIRAEILRALQLIDPVDPKVTDEFKKRLRDQEPEVQEAARAALAAEEKKASSPEPSKPAPVIDDSLQLRQVVTALIAKKKPGASFGLVSEVVREPRRAAVGWIGIGEGKVLGADVVALVFERQSDGSWTPLADPVLLSQGEGANKLAEALGGADKQRVVQLCGVPRDKLSEHLSKWGCAFKLALAANKPEEAMAAFEELSKAFSFPVVAFNNLLPDGLAKGSFCDAPWKIDPACASDGCKVEIQAKDKPVTGQVGLRSCGQGWVIAELPK